VQGLGSAKSLASGFYHSLALLSDGSVWGWGRNAEGQLGPSLAPAVVTPTRINFGSGPATAISAGLAHSEVLQGSNIISFGDDSRGELGDGLSASQQQFSRVLGLPGPPERLGTSIGARSFAMARDPNAFLSIVGWGDDDAAELGHGVANGGNTDTGLPTIVNAPSSPTVSLAGGGFHTLSVQQDGTVHGWGGNWAGQLGDGTLIARPSPIRVGQLTGITQVAVRADGTLWAWGDNSFGQLGDGTTIQRNSPVQVTGLLGIRIVGISAGEAHVLAKDSNNHLWASGANWSDQLGDGTLLEQHTPRRIPFLASVRFFTAGLDHSAAGG
jgi:alpha-tubulin suppressor-like RCC1 family protein